MNRLHRLLSITLAFALVACTITQRRADQLAALANVALVAAEISQRISPGQAALVRAHGRLILDTSRSSLSVRPSWQVQLRHDGRGFGDQGPFLPDFQTVCP